MTETGAPNQVGDGEGEGRVPEEIAAAIDALSDAAIEHAREAMEGISGDALDRSRTAWEDAQATLDATILRYLREAEAGARGMRLIRDDHVRIINELRAENERLRAATAEAGGWRPISEAQWHNRNRDGSSIQPRVIGSDGFHVGEARNYDGDWYWACSGEKVKLTAWCPLPAPPTAETLGSACDANVRSRGKKPCGSI